MGKQTHLYSDEPSSGCDDDDDDSNDYNVKLTEIAKGTECGYDNMQSRLLSGNWGDKLKTAALDPCKMTAEGVASLIKENGHLTSTEKQQLVWLLLKYLGN